MGGEHSSVRCLWVGGRFVRAEGEQVRYLEVAVEPSLDDSAQVEFQRAWIE